MIHSRVTDEMLVNLYKFMMYVFTEYFIRSLKWKFTKIMSPYFFISVCSLVYDCNAISVHIPYELNMKDHNIYISTGFTGGEMDFIFLTIMLANYFLQYCYFTIYQFFNLIQHSMLVSLSRYMIYPHTVSTINTLDWIQPAIFLAYFVILFISIHDRLWLSFSQHSMLCHLYEVIIDLSTEFTNNSAKWLLTNGMSKFWYFWSFMF